MLPWWIPVALAADDLRWSVLPNASYDTDDGLGFGARGQIDLLDEGYEPYRASFVVHLFATTNGYHHHRFRFDLVGLGPHQRGRLFGHFAFRAWLNDGYWGVGNGTTLDAAYVGSFDDDDPARRFYRYRLEQPFGHLTFRRDLGGPWAVYAGVEGRYSFVDPYDGSLLAADHPFGMDGGGAAQVAGGVLFDTRDPEITPSRGLYVEVSARGVAMPDTVFGGPFVCARGWLTIAPPVVFAGRVMGEYLGGDVPFYEMVHWGGFIPTAGFGGADTVRGIPFGRWRAPGKLVANGEMRIDVLRHPLFGQELRWQVVPYADVGAVFGAGDAADAPAPASPFHPAVGLGVRPIWGETLVGRLDTGIGWDTVVAADGARSARLSWGFYLMFDHLF